MLFSGTVRLFRFVLLLHAHSTWHCLFYITSHMYVYIYIYMTLRNTHFGFVWLLHYELLYIYIWHCTFFTTLHIFGINMTLHIAHFTFEWLIFCTLYCVPHYICIYIYDIMALSFFIFSMYMTFAHCTYCVHGLSHFRTLHDLYDGLRLQVWPQRPSSCHANTL